MKIRHGFVSNSSSSSYVIIVTQKDHDEILKKMHPYYKAWFDEWEPAKKRKFLGKNICVFSAYVSTEDDEPIEWKGEYPPEAEDYYGNGEKMVTTGDVIYEYEETAKKLKKEIIMDQQDC